MSALFGSASTAGSVVAAAIPSFTDCASKAAFESKSVTDGIAAATADPTVLADPNNADILKLYQDPSALGTALDGDTSFLNASDPRLAAPFLEGFNNATTTVYWVGLAVVLVAFVLSFFLKAAPLREKSALQENSDNEAAETAQAAAAASGALVAPDVAFEDETPAPKTTR